MPFPFISSLFVTMILIFGILYEPAPKSDFLDPLMNKNSFLKGASQLAEGFTDKKVGKKKVSEKIIKDQVPIVAAANKKGEGAANKFFNEEEQYEVVGGDTLMLIAFKLFGDYHFWKELAKWNKEFLGKSHGLDIGMNLKFFKLKRENSWPPEGNPYMIKKGDFLTKISEKIYGTSRKWRKIFKRNKLMIKNPNLIFAGFTLFYDSKALKL